MKEKEKEKNRTAKGMVRDILQINKLNSFTKNNISILIRDENSFISGVRKLG